MGAAESLHQRTVNIAVITKNGFLQENRKPLNNNRNKSFKLCYLDTSNSFHNEAIILFVTFKGLGAINLPKVYMLAKRNCIVFIVKKKN